MFWGLPLARCSGRRCPKRGDGDGFILDHGLSSQSFKSHVPLPPAQVLSLSALISHVDYMSTGCRNIRFFATGKCWWNIGRYLDATSTRESHVYICRRAFPRTCPWPSRRWISIRIWYVSEIMTHDSELEMDLLGGVDLRLRGSG
jgi:hypothetical protein